MRAAAAISRNARTGSGRIFFWLTIFAVSSLSEVVAADGVVEVRGAYYKERSTRVAQPMLDAAFDTSAHGRIDGHFLVDSITSASSSTGAVGGEFTELRYEGGLGYSHELPGHVKLGLQGKYSTESDYVSTWLAASAELALFDQNTTLRLLGGHSFDSMTNGVALEQGSLGTPPRAETLDTTLLSLSVSQLLTPHLVLGFIYDFMYLDGCQANLYRLVRGGVDAVPERVPQLRLRNAAAFSLRGYLTATRTTGVVSYRLYIDDWGIVGHTPELRLIQEIVHGLELRVRYRFHTQNQADFYKSIYSQMELNDSMTWVTADDKLSAFTTHTVGGQVSLALHRLGFVGGFGDTRIDLVVERIFQSTSFGDAWVGELGLSIPFGY